MDLTIKEILQRALEFFGPNGENWVQGHPDINTQACALIGISRVSDNEGDKDQAKQCLRDVIGGSIVEWNDARGRTWADVKTAYEQAIEAA